MFTRSRKASNKRREKKTYSHTCCYVWTRWEKKVRFKDNWQPVKFYSIASLHSKAVFSARETDSIPNNGISLCFVHILRARWTKRYLHLQPISKPTTNFHLLFTALSLSRSYSVCHFLTRVLLFLVHTKVTFWTSLWRIRFIHTFGFYVISIYTTVIATKFARTNVYANKIIENASPRLENRKEKKIVSEDIHCSCCWHCQWRSAPFFGIRILVKCIAL